jgi:hypothetical protein
VIDREGSWRVAPDASNGHAAWTVDAQGCERQSNRSGVARELDAPDRAAMTVVAQIQLSAPNETKKEVIAPTDLLNFLGHRLARCVD